MITRIPIKYTKEIEQDIIMYSRKIIILSFSIPWYECLDTGIIRERMTIIKRVLEYIRKIEKS